MHLEIINYHSNYYQSWLDLVALSSIELKEEYYIWNARPQLTEKSHQLLALNPTNNELIASVDLEPNEEGTELIVKHWSCRKFAISEYVEFIQRIANNLKLSICIWVSSHELVMQLEKISTLLEKRVLFFLEGKNVANTPDELGFCDHLFAYSTLKNWDFVQNNYLVVNKNFLSPKFQQNFKIIPHQD